MFTGIVEEMGQVEGIQRDADGALTVTYVVADSDRHVVSRQRSVRYTDYVPPRFSLTQELRYSMGSSIRIKDRMSAWDVIDGDLSDRIKVNSVCQGNFFDGPLWSDPEKGLFVQYLNSGKVPGAKTVADVKLHYEKQIPMHRGCYPSDVAKAIVYAVCQSYETGQAIPVTGGQVMLN